MKAQGGTIEQRILARLRPSPRQDSRLAVRRFGDDAEQPIRLYVFCDVLEELAFSSGYEESSICTAILSGGFGMEPEGGFVEVSGFHGLQRLKSADDLYPAVRKTTDDWIRSASDDALVGLFVSRPHSGAHLDEDVARVHFSLMNIPFQPIVMYDPVDELLGVYAREPGGAFFEAAYRAVAADRSLKRGMVSGKPAESEE